MLMRWTQTIKDPKAKEDFEAQVKSAKPVLDRLYEIIEEDEKGLETIDSSVRAYDNPNWPYRQAHVNGYKGAFKNIKTLINLDPKETK